MKSYLLVLSILLLAVSCSNSPKNKIEGTDSQAIADGSGQQLTVDTQASSIHWVGTKPGGSHHGTIAIKEGNLAINGTEVASGSFTIDMNAIVDEDLTDKKMNDMLVTHLKSADFFDVAKYPTSSFTITKVEAVSGNDSITHRISGNLKMKDAEKNITFDAKITKEGDAYKAVTVPFTIDRTQWNVQYGSKSIFADLKDKFIDDNIELQITIIAKAASK